MDKNKIESEISKALNDLLKYSGIFISAGIISDHIGFNKDVVITFVTEEQLDIIDDHNLRNFGTIKYLEYKMAKSVACALLNGSSITLSCSEAGVSMNEYVRVRPLIYNDNHKYIHFDIQENEYYF